MSDPGELPVLPASDDIVNPILLGIASFHVLEVLLAVFQTFERHQGLYFGSITVSLVSLTGYIASLFMMHFSDEPNVLSAAGYVHVVSYATLLTAHILVLYSRLHLVLYSRRLLRWILVMIIATSAALGPLHITTMSLYVSTFYSKRYYDLELTTEFVVVFGAMAREFFICGIYIVQAYCSFHPIAQMKGKTGRRVLMHLMLVQACAIALDIGIAVQFSQPALRRAANGYNALMFSIKLKMEVAVLNSLVCLLKSPIILGSRSGSDGELELEGGGVSLNLGLAASGVTNRSGP
ncbi:uncharacterized protein DSM5745_04403 [Aspergillus mulundensis]|uniref:DUF7703 domain-containing protein n=1 Tax=Aspergillus mulundensis TaxID=1810919 RepID=A0A3D8SCK1_9EURO|nr:hypothetical protein DSM5745_04403 [Aspergillus mulundensis]RDW84077.1 hypothetical protein DSM5745_04403 [Aspergillus mulundensis]